MGQVMSPVVHQSSRLVQSKKNYSTFLNEFYQIDNCGYNMKIVIKIETSELIQQNIKKNFIENFFNSLEMAFK